MSLLLTLKILAIGMAQATDSSGDGCPVDQRLSRFRFRWGSGYRQQSARLYVQRYNFKTARANAEMPFPHDADSTSGAKEDYRCFDFKLVNSWSHSCNVVALQHSGGKVETERPAARFHREACSVSRTK
jgi:hypothetical protein